MLQPLSRGPSGPRLFCVQSLRFRFSRELPVEGGRWLSERNQYMNAREKDAIRAMRKSGSSYASISIALGISENTIKSFCRRNNFGGVAGQSLSDAYQGEKQCLHCKTQLVQTAGRKPRKFCSESCRMKWWNRRSTAPGRKNTRSFICLACGKQFDAYGRRERKYCSRSCCASSKAGCQ